MNDGRVGVVRAGLCCRFLRLSATAISARASIHGLGIREIRMQLANCRPRIRRWNPIERDAVASRDVLTWTRRNDTGADFGGLRSERSGAAQMRKRDDHRDSSAAMTLLSSCPLMFFPSENRRNNLRHRSATEPFSFVFHRIQNTIQDVLYRVSRGSDILRAACHYINKSIEIPLLIAGYMHCD